MDFIDTVKFQIFPADVGKVESIGTATLKDFIDTHKNPSQKLEDTFKKLRENRNNEAMRDYIKTQELFYYTPSVWMDGKGRGYVNVESFNPVAMIEFDNLKQEMAKYLKEYIFYKYPFCIASYISPSGNGAKTLHRIPKANSVEEYKEYWFGLAYIFQDIPGFDVSNQNCVLPLFVSQDKEMLFRKNPTEISQKGFREDSFKELTEDELNSLSVGEGVSEITSQKAYEVVCNMFNSITDNGHPQVIRFSLMAGGFFGWGYGDIGTWNDTIEDCIRSNPYLSRGSRGGSNYITTAKQFFNRGIKSPLPIRNNK